MPSLQYESTQHCFQMMPILHFAKKGNGRWSHHCHMKVLRIYFQMTPLLHFTQKGNGTWCHHCHVKVLKYCFQMIPILYYYQKGQWDINQWCHHCHHYHVKVHKICFLMITILYVIKKGMVITWTTTFTLFPKWQWVCVWENGLVKLIIWQ